jgi:hypothetical protein
LTYISFWLEAKKPGLQDKRFIRYDLPNPPSGRFGPYALKGWATRERLEIDYVDNCWLRVRVQRTKLVEFLQELYGPRSEPQTSFVASQPRSSEFTIVAEEF